MTSRSIGEPPVSRLIAVVFDTDGVVTRTASVHSAAWKALFDTYLRVHASSSGEAFVPFDEEDYLRYVDGVARYDGVERFLNSRGINLSRGLPGDAPGTNTVCALGNAKNEQFLEQIRLHGVEPFETTLTLARELRRNGIATAVVSASESCAAVLQAAGATDLFDVRVDGVDAQELGLASKPEPALFLEAARRLGVDPTDAAVVEDALAGVEAGRRGGFGLVVGVDRTGHAAALTERGADVVVADLASFTVDSDGRWRATPEDQSTAELPSALGNAADLHHRLAKRQVAIFCDYDGTLTPIVARPELAQLDPATRAVLERLADQCVVAIISGRDLTDVMSMMGTDKVWYAGSHGFDLCGPNGERDERGEGLQLLDELAVAATELEQSLLDVAGAWVERKRFAVAIHFRQVEDDRLGDVEAAVDRARDTHPALRKTGGKRIFELRPDVEWDKGRALWWVFERAGLRADRTVPIYLGDDVTDEDAFAALGDRGIGIVVDDGDRSTHASYRLENPREAREFLIELSDWLERRDG